MISWPRTAGELAREQERLRSLPAVPWAPRPGPLRVAACAVVFRRRGGGDDVGWAAAVVQQEGAILARAERVARVDVPFEPGRLALREGALLHLVVRQLGCGFDVLLVGATGRDHPRGAGLALHLGAALGVPSVGVTDRPLVASGDEPGPSRGDRAPLRVRDDVVAYRVRTHAGTRPVVAHAAWRVAPEDAAELVLATAPRTRWPEPLREARRLAREARTHAAAESRPAR